MPEARRPHRRPGRAPTARAARAAARRGRAPRRAARRLRARRELPRSLWLSLGMMGLVGRSVAVPTLVGVALGWWIDRAWPGRVSWTLTLLLVGLVLGCLNAWRGVRGEGRPR